MIFILGEFRSLKDNMKKNAKKGSVILEALIAIGIGAMFFSAIASAMVIIYQNSGVLFKTQKALWVSQETTSAIRAIDFSDLAILESGLLTFDTLDGTYSLISGEAEQLDGGLTRSITVSEVKRDDDCLVVQDDGTVDPDSYYIENQISWSSATGRSQEIGSKTLVTNWEDPNGECFMPVDAGSVFVDTSGSYWGGSRQLRGVTLINSSSEDIIIDKITMEWSFSWARLSQIFIVETKAWSANGPGTPLGYQYSGTEIDIFDTSIPSGETVDAYKIQFTATMKPSWVKMKFEFTDGSIYETEPFYPSW